MGQAGFVGVSWVVALLIGMGCEPADPSVDLGPAAPASVPAPSSPWRTTGGSARIAVEDPELVRTLDAAAGQARAGLEQARRRWEEADREGRSRWSVKWAARTEDGGTEHLWVLPLRWSAYRVEGLLLDSPRRPLRLGHGEGDLVAFPIEELSDWLHVDEQGRREGGYTIAVLEEWFGIPPGSPDPEP